MNKIRIESGQIQVQASPVTNTPCGCCTTQLVKTENRTAGAPNTDYFTVPDIVCEGCAGSIKKALGRLESVTGVDVDVHTKIVTVAHDGVINREVIVKALEHAGYSVF